eukprot:871093-Alexandrium_andersonii.AAC.1
MSLHHSSAACACPRFVGMNLHRVCAPTQARAFRVHSFGSGGRVRHAEPGAPGPERRLDIEG